MIKIFEHIGPRKPAKPIPQTFFKIPGGFSIGKEWLWITMQAQAQHRSLCIGTKNSYLHVNFFSAKNRPVKW